MYNHTAEMLNYWYYTSILDLKWYDEMSKKFALNPQNVEGK